MKAVLWLGVAAGGLVLLSLLGFWLAVRPPRIAIPLQPKDFNLRPEEVTVRAVDGVSLAGWYLPRPGAPGIVLLHGYPAEKADLLPLAAALHPEFAVLLMDLRYFGRSGGRTTTLGLRERDDLKLAVGWLQARGVQPIGVFGLSLGGAVALLAAAEDPRIRAVAAYAHFWLLKYPLVELMRLWSRLFLGADVTRPSPLAAAARVACAVLLVHSRDDEQIAFHHAERLQRALAANPAADFHFLPRGRHGETGGDFERRLAEFFRTHLTLRGRP